MTDPARWSDVGSGATRFERVLVARGRRIRPPEGARAWIWDELIATVDELTRAERGRDSPSVSGVRPTVAASRGQKR